MKLCVALVALFASAVTVLGVAGDPTNEDHEGINQNIPVSPLEQQDTKPNEDPSLSEEDGVFWERFLTWGRNYNQGYHWNTGGTGTHHHHRQPTPTHYYSFAPQPAPQPVPAPPQNCFVEVDLKCRTASGTPCNQIRPRNSQCQETIIWEIVMRNTGSIEMVIDMVDVFHEGQRVDLLNTVANRNPIFPGQTVQTQQRIDIDVCRPNQFDGRVAVSASPPRGAPCYGNDSYGLYVVHGVAVVQSRSVRSLTRHLGNSLLQQHWPCSDPKPHPTAPCRLLDECPCRLPSAIEWTSLQLHSTT